MPRKPKKRKSNKPKPSDLGTGQAARAGRALQKRKSKLDKRLKAATGSKKKRKTKKRK